MTALDIGNGIRRHIQNLNCAQESRNDVPQTFDLHTCLVLLITVTVFNTAWNTRIGAYAYGSRAQCHMHYLFCNE